MSLGVHFVGNQSPYSVVRDHGQSDEARTLYRLFQSVRGAWEQTATGNGAQAVNAAITRVHSRCSQVDWDGEGAAAVSDNAILDAFVVSRMLPTLFPQPEVDADPDGCVSFTWYQKRGFSFTLCAYGDGKVVYAGLFGQQSKVHGTEPLGDVLPESTIACLRRLYGK